VSDRPTERILRGTSLSPGFGEGDVVLYPVAYGSRRRLAVTASDPETEVRRLEAALEAARRELERIRIRVQADIGAAEAEIFAAHEALLADRDFLARILERIRRDRLAAEPAVEAEVATATKHLIALDEPYLRERAADVRDLGRRILLHLVSGGHHEVAPLVPGSVLVAAELFPSDTVDLDRNNVSGIVTEVGGQTSHVAILARALGIPAVTAIRDATDVLRSGDHVLVDGERGEVIVAPSEPQRRAFGVRRDTWTRAASAARLEEVSECVTRDGTRVTLLANLARVEEAPEVRLHHLGGVGLLRTEFLFLDAEQAPSFDEHLAAYRQISELLGGLPLTIRTLDLGGDKIPSFLAAHAERNPSLGLRGLRFSLRRRDLFDTQLAAIACAARSGPTRVLFPMVLGGADVREAKACLAHASGRVAGAASVQIGAMIETPAAVFLIDEILAEVDFVSLGTNDLTQLVLAADRDAIDLLEGYSLLHPAVLRAIRRVVEAARAGGRRVSVCGESAGDPATALLLVGLGVYELSMSPRRAARVRHAIRSFPRSDLEGLAREALGASSIREVTDGLAAFVARVPLTDQVDRDQNTT
jgi:phosphoenolpyruvate-protein phosphotransferase